MDESGHDLHQDIATTPFTDPAEEPWMDWATPEMAARFADSDRPPDDRSYRGVPPERSTGRG